ncbi:protein HEXIM1-like [Mustelus asterias]
MGEQLLAECPPGSSHLVPSAPVSQGDEEREERGCSPGDSGGAPPPPPSPGPVAQGVPRPQPRKRHRRRPSKKKRRWRPYFKLSWEEKKALDERESVRAAKTRAEMFAKGFTVAPYNTTQFLMEEHNQEEPDLNTGPGAAAAAGGGGGAAAAGGGGGGRLCPPRRAARPADPSDDDEEELLLLDEEEQQDSGSDGMGGHGGGEFLQRDFSETYERYHAESLHNMSKQELIREYLELEKCLSRLEDENNRLRGRLDGLKAAGGGEAARQTQVEGELEKLRAENQRLQRENELYKQERCLENGK